jgi:hypothetical protein
MFPAKTASPPYFLTPRRRPAESRPFLELPPAFFVAMIGYPFIQGACFTKPTPLVIMNKALSLNVGDPQHGQILTVTSFATIILATLHFENDDFGSAGMFNQLSNHGGTSNKRRANGGFIAFTNHQNLIQCQGVTGFTNQFFNLNHIIFLNPVLFPAGFHNCKHGLILKSLWSFRDLNRLQNGLILIKPPENRMIFPIAPLIKIKS